jgi:hypothetical protein
MSEPAAAATPDTAARHGPVPLRRNSGFQMLWIGQLLSDTGSEMGLIAYPLLILALTHSPVLAGVVGTAREIALICLQLPAGALSDRFDRRLTMIACDTARGPAGRPRHPHRRAPRVLAGHPRRQRHRRSRGRPLRPVRCRRAARDRGGRAACGSVGRHRGPDLGRQPGRPRARRAAIRPGPGRPVPGRRRLLRPRSAR